MAEPLTQPNPTRKLFYGLFIFPLLITVGMAVLLCSVVLLTHEDESPETLIAAIKSGSQSKRWQKAFELSNELNRAKGTLRSGSVEREIIYILKDSAQFDAKTRSYMAIALSHFPGRESAAALAASLADADPTVQLYSLWSLGVIRAAEHADAVSGFLRHENADLRKTAAYVLGAMGDRSHAAALKPLLEDANVDVKWNAALALARLGDRSGMSVLLRMLDRETLAAAQGLSDQQIEPVMINAVKAIALLRDADNAHVLERLSRGDRSLRVRQAAIDALHFIKEAR